jgi:heterodisulfide reductase subunit A-like polyferredoxin
MPKISPALTDMEGVFVAGVAAGPKDIVETIVEAGAAAMEASNYLLQFKKTDGRDSNSEFGMRNAERKKEDREQKAEDGIQAVLAG